VGSGHWQLGGSAAELYQRLKAAPNATTQIEDGQALDLPDDSFDAVICSLGLMFFPDPARGLSEAEDGLPSRSTLSRSDPTTPASIL
jgi:SAM-dependent methyltransferase